MPQAFQMLRDTAEPRKGEDPLPIRKQAALEMELSAMPFNLAMALSCHDKD